MNRKVIIKFLLFIGFCYTLNSFAESPSITLDHYSTQQNDDNYSLIFNFNGNIKYHCISLQDPDRLVIDFDKVRLKKPCSIEKNDYIRKVRSSDHDHQFLRLVFDLKELSKYTTQFDQRKHMLTVVLKKTTQSKHKNDQFTLPSELPDLKNDEVKEQKYNEEISDENASDPHVAIEIKDLPKIKKVVVVIDPGHGGKDPGAQGLHGAREKDVVLKISKELQNLLNKEPGFTAIMTRNTDFYISLRKRLEIARRNHADMFVAIHADAYHHSHATGASVYALSQRGATSEAAKWLAEKENESELGGLSSELADKDAMLRSVLIDLSQTHTIASSLHIGRDVLTKLGRNAPLHHPRVEQAAFVVLKSPDIPSILVETGFLSNPLEEEKLTNKVFQRQTAYAIKEGIKKYFLQNSPFGTWFSQHKKRVERDD